MKKRKDFEDFNFFWALQYVSFTVMLFVLTDWPIALIIVLSIYLLAVHAGRDADYSDYQFDQLNKRIKELEDDYRINQSSSLDAKTTETGRVGKSTRDSY